VIRGGALYDIIVGMGSPKKTRKSCERRGRRTRKGGKNTSNSDNSNSNSNSNSDTIDRILDNIEEYHSLTEIEYAETEINKKLRSLSKNPKNPDGSDPFKFTKIKLQKDLHNIVDERERTMKAIATLNEYITNNPNTNKLEEIHKNIKILEEREPERDTDYVGSCLEFFSIFHF